MIPPVITAESEEEKLQRLANFTKWCPFEMPNSYNLSFLMESMTFKANDLTTMDEDNLLKLKNDILNLLQQFTTSNKLRILKIC